MEAEELDREIGMKRVTKKWIIYRSCILTSVGIQDKRKTVTVLRSRLSLGRC